MVIAIIVREGSHPCRWAIDVRQHARIEQIYPVLIHDLIGLQREHRFRQQMTEVPIPCRSKPFRIVIVFLFGRVVKAFIVLVDHPGECEFLIRVPELGGNAFEASPRLDDIHSIVVLVYVPQSVREYCIHGGYRFVILPSYDIAYDLRHTSGDHECSEVPHHHLIRHIIQRYASFDLGSQIIYHLVGYTSRPKELFEVQGIHGDCPLIPYADRRWFSSFVDSHSRVGYA